jgi:hypothetical protein
LKELEEPAGSLWEARMNSCDPNGGKRLESRQVSKYGIGVAAGADALAASCGLPDTEPH